MRRSLKATLPFLAATVLLGSSAFAECPQFNGPLPNVIVTDVTPAGTADITANFFVYTDAFDLVDYIDFGSTGLTDASYAFNEFTTGSSTPSTGAARIYTLNGDLGAATVPATAAAVDAAAAGGNGGTVAADGLLSFRNVKLSPVGPSTFPAPAGSDVTAPDNTRTITMYLVAPSSSATCFVDGEIDVRSFEVITELGSAGSPDRLTGAACSFTPFLDYPTFDSAWNYGELDPAFTSPPASLGAPTIPGYGGSAPAATAAIGIASTAGLTTTFATWRNNLGVSLDADTIYRVRSVVNSNSTVNQSNWVRIRIGGDFFAENGQGEQGYTSNASSMPRASRTQNLLHWVKSASAGSSLPGGSDQPAYNFDLIDESNTIGGHNFTVSGVTIDTLTRACLGTGTVLRNKGVAAVSNEDGYTPSATGLTPFAGGDGYSVLNLNDAGVTVTVGTSTAAPVAGAMNITFTTAAAGDQTGFGALLVSGNPGEANVTIDNTKLYAMDLWISAPIAGNTTTSRLPVIRTRWIADQSVGGNHGQTHSAYYNLNPDQDYNGTADNANGLSAANSAKHYVGYWWPDLDLTAQPITTSNYFVDFLYNRAGATAVRPNGTFSIERLSITEYDQPTF